MLKSIKSFLNSSSSKSIQKFMHKKRHLNDRSIFKAIKTFIGDDISDEEKQKLANDIRACIKKYAVSADEYFYYGFRGASHEKRNSFIPFYEHKAIALKINSPESRSVFVNKYRTYEKFKPYYKREIINITPNQENNLEIFSKFCENHEKFIIKPTDKSGGNGIRIINTSEIKNAEDCLKDLLSKAPQGFVAEEVVTQCAELSEFHPFSVNTVRISTLVLKDRIEIIHPFFKLGQGGKVVDNGASGGILATVDKDTGIVKAASDEHGNIFKIHPDSKLPIVGFKIPKWEELISMAKEIAAFLPNNRFTGWDFALTDNGWVLIEGNGIGGFVGWQLVDKEGFRDELYGLLKELN